MLLRCTPSCCICFYVTFRGVRKGAQPVGSDDPVASMAWLAAQVIEGRDTIDWNRQATFTVFGECWDGLRILYDYTIIYIATDCI